MDKKTQTELDLKIFYGFMSSDIKKARVNKDRHGKDEAALFV